MIGLLIIIGSFFQIPLQSGHLQISEDPVSVIHFFNEKTLTYDIYCENLGPDTYSIELDFEVLQDLRPSTPYPLRKTILPGRHLVMKLTQHDLNSRGYFQITLTYRRGNLTYDISEDYPYLLPLNAGTLVQTYCADSLQALYSEQKDTSFYVSGFKAMGGDTIFASRRGVVSKIQNHVPQDSFNSPDIGNYIDIQHINGTYARYERIQENSALVELGQIVEAGDPIALVPLNSLEESSFFTFRTFYYSEKVVTCKLGPSNTKMTTIPVFFHGAGKSCLLTAMKTYEVQHPEEIICREMGRRDLKKWAKRNKSRRF